MIFKLSNLTRQMLYQRKPLKPPLTYIWWRRYTPSTWIPGTYIS